MLFNFFRMSAIPARLRTATLVSVPGSGKLHAWPTSLIPPTLIGSAPISGTSSGQKGWRNSWPERSRGPDLPTTTWVNGEFLKSYYPLLTVVVSCPTRGEKNVMYILDPLESNSFGYALSIPVHCPPHGDIEANGVVKNFFLQGSKHVTLFAITIQARFNVSNHKKCTHYNWTLSSY